MHGFMLFMGNDSKFIRGEEFGDISSEGESVGEDVINTFNSVTEDSSSSCLWMKMYCHRRKRIILKFYKIERRPVPRTSFLYLDKHWHII